MRVCKGKKYTFIEGKTYIFLYSGYWYYIYIYIYIYIGTQRIEIYIAQSAEAVEYFDGSSAESKTPPTSVLDKTLNNLMVRFQ